ncbi:MAG TPA: class I SAM-dependent methyltransferase [Candidatus Acidoferrales bacterium]|nr:class I SAM-dependent methyltransferase [Candidatus Acidoferrales bacterium]
MTDWYEDDEFWEAFAPFFFTPERIAGSSAQCDELLKLLRVAPGSHVLDLCCGVGRHSVELARRGFVVTGVDRTRPLLERARQTAASIGLNVEWVLEDMRAFRRAGAFDGAINCVTSFGYFEDPAEDLLVARNLHEALKPNARLVIEMMGKEVLARIFQPRSWERLSNGAIWLQEHKLRSGWDWLETQWTIIDNARRTELTFTHRPYSGAELTAVLKDAGFREVELFGSLGGAPYDHRADRLVAVATK